MRERVLSDKTNMPRNLVEQLIEKEGANLERKERLPQPTLEEEVFQIEQGVKDEEMQVVQDENAAGLANSKKRMRSPCKPFGTRETDIKSPLAQRPRIVVSSVDQEVPGAFVL